MRNEQCNARLGLCRDGLCGHMVGGWMLGMVFDLVSLATLISNLCDRDVAAGIAILSEAGGLITTANPPSDPATAHIEEVRLGSRLYLAIRYVFYFQSTHT
jgi:hypothetical protein